MKEQQNDENEKDTPPGAPDRTPVEDPERREKSPIKDPFPPGKKKKRLR